MGERGKELLEHGLKDMYDAEHRFADALGTMIEKANEPELVDGFRRHLEITKEQARRLEKAFEAIGETATREECPGSKGLVEEFEKFVREEQPDPATLDAFAAEAGLKVEHYEIVSYKSLINLADFMGEKDCVKLLKQNLKEEQETAKELEVAGERLAANLTGAEVPKRKTNGGRSKAKKTTTRKRTGATARKRTTSARTKAKRGGTARSPRKGRTTSRAKRTAGARSSRTGRSRSRSR